MMEYDQMLDFLKVLRGMPVLGCQESGPCEYVSSGKIYQDFTSHTLSFLLISLTVIIQYYLAMLQ